MLTLDRVRELLRYDANSGHFSWQIAPSNAIRAGNRAGKMTPSGYIRIRIDGRCTAAHHLAWFLMTGEWPTAEVDHKNGNKSDNSWANLRLATRSQNSANTRQRRAGEIKGYSPKDGKFRARIMVNGRLRVLGYFTTESAARAAYVEAARGAFGEFAEGF